MNKIAVVVVLIATGFAHAQSTTPKKELVARILTLQQQAIEQTGQILIERPALQLQQQAGMALQIRVAPEKREAVAKQIQQDLKKYVDEVGPVVRQQAVKLAPSTIGALLEEKFTEDELKQLVSIMESPVNRKFIQMGGEFQKALGEQLIAQTKTIVEPKINALDKLILSHLGAPAPAATPARDPQNKSPKK
jgi:hypothetical protein